MPLASSGQMSIGGSTASRSINLELGRSASATSSLGESALRTLAGVSSGAISMSNFYGKSSGPTTASLGGTDMVYLASSYFFYGGYYEAVRDIVLFSNGTGAYRMGDSNTALYNVETFTWLTGGSTNGNYYAYVQVLNGNGFTSGDAVNTALPLSTSRGWQWTLATYNNTVGGYTEARVQIRNASGTVLAQRDVYISASIINGYEP